MTLGIYKIESPSGSFYIGSSTNVARRFTTHKRELRKGTHVNSVLRNACNKYGIDSFSFVQIVSVLHRKDLRLVEQQLIDELAPEYNISQNADCPLFDDAVMRKRVATLSKPVTRLTDGKVFASGYAAAREHGEKSSDNISTAIRKGWKFAGHFWKFSDSDITLEQLTVAWNERDTERRANASSAATKAKSRAVRRISDGAIFASGIEAARALGTYRTMVNDSIRMNAPRMGSRWEYV